MFRKLMKKMSEKRNAGKTSKPISKKWTNKGKLTAQGKRNPDGTYETAILQKEKPIKTLIMGK